MNLQKVDQRSILCILETKEKGLEKKLPVIFPSMSDFIFVDLKVECLCVQEIK